MKVLGYGVGNGVVMINEETYSVNLTTEYGRWVVAYDDEGVLVLSVTEEKYGKDRIERWFLFPENHDLDDLTAANVWPPLDPVVTADTLMPASDYEAEAEAFESLS